MITQGELVILGTSLLASSAYALIAPFFPLELEDKGISDANIGYIFSIYSVAIILFSPFVGRYLEFVGFSTMLFGGLGLLGACFILFGIIDRLEDPQSVLKLSLLLRFVQGIAAGMTFTTIYSIITNKYPHKKTALLGMLEATFGIGLIFGPLAGALLFNQFGFEKTFYIYGTAFLLCTFCIWYFTEPIRYNVPPPTVAGMSETGGFPAINNSNSLQSQKSLRGKQAS